MNCVNLVKNKSDEIIIGSVEYNYFVNSTNEWYTEYDHKKFIDFKIVEKIKSYLSEVNIKIFLELGVKIQEEKYQYYLKY